VPLFLKMAKVFLTPLFLKVATKGFLTSLFLKVTKGRKNEINSIYPFLENGYGS
jgi:hypothetical protein